ncbi:MAG TPA: hypothetical protein VLN08_00610 [Vicinamibacterales bacterium]|nr:hypothetical protein [Vicinamibacterales bacterium]
MRIKIQGADARSGDPALCLSCRHATVVKGARLRDEIIECGMLTSGHNRITFPVTSCTEHVSRQHASIREMEDIAWVLRTDTRRRQVGFVQAKDLTARERHILPEYD